MDDIFRIDSTKLHFHPHRVAQLLDGRDDWERAKEIYPIYVEVSPVSVCNHACTFCGIDYVIEAAKDSSASMKMLDSSVFGERVHEMATLGIKSVMFAGEGEPLLHKHINDMVEHTVASGIDVSFTTNGTLLHKLDDLDRCTWIKVSLNAGTRETYSKVHRTGEKDWTTVWANLRAAAKRKGRCTLGVQMVLLPENEHEAPQLQTLCDDAGVDYLVLKPYSQHASSITHEYEGWKTKLQTVEVKPWQGLQPKPGTSVVLREESINTTEIPYDKCHATPYLWAYLMASGDLYSCSAYLLDDRFRLGNINDQTFRDIWHGERRRANWEYVRKQLDIKECRLNCRMDKANRYLDQFGKQLHINFI